MSIGKLILPELNSSWAGFMRNVLCTLMGVCGLVGVLWPNVAASQMMQLPAIPRPPSISPPADSPKRYVPLGQVLPRATQESGVQFQAPDPVLREEVPVSESGPNRNINLEPVLDGFSRIELFGNDSELKKVIILNRNTGAQSQAPVSATPSKSYRKPASRSTPSKKPATRTAPSQSLPTTKLTQKQLQELIRGAYRSALPEKLWDDPGYREFLTGQGINSREEMNDRNKAKNVRKTVRRLLWQLKNKS